MVLPFALIVREARTHQNRVTVFVWIVKQIPFKVNLGWTVGMPVLMVNCPNVQRPSANYQPLSIQQNFHHPHHQHCPLSLTAAAAAAARTTTTLFTFIGNTQVPGYPMDFTFD